MPRLSGRAGQTWIRKQTLELRLSLEHSSRETKAQRLADQFDRRVAITELFVDEPGPHHDIHVLRRH